MTKFKKVFARLFWSESQHDVVLASDDDATFNVNLGKLLIGTLMYTDGLWYFNYSDEFKIQNRIAPLANFPSKEKEYVSSELWPFFTSRIPSNAQLQLEKEAPTEDLVSLLIKFGRKTVANPYELSPVL
jgi:HipA-like protein